MLTECHTDCCNSQLTRSTMRIPDCWWWRSVTRVTSCTAAGISQVLCYCVRDEYVVGSAALHRNFDCCIRFRLLCTYNYCKWGNVVSHGHGSRNTIVKRCAVMDWLKALSSPVAQSPIWGHFQNNHLMIWVLELVRASQAMWAIPCWFAAWHGPQRSL